MPKRGTPKTFVTPTRESFHLGHARALYLDGQLTLEQFERSAEHVLLGSHLRQDGTPSKDEDLPWTADPEIFAFKVIV